MKVLSRKLHLPSKHLGGKMKHAGIHLGSKTHHPHHCHHGHHGHYLHEEEKSDLEHHHAPHNKHHHEHRHEHPRHSHDIHHHLPMDGHSFLNHGADHRAKYDRKKNH